MPFIEAALKNEAELVARAETQAYEEEHEDAVTTLEFRIKHHLEFGQLLFLTGSVRTLGEWNAMDGAIPMKWTEGDLWTCEATVRRSEVPKLEYKYIVKSGKDSVQWESGGNHNVLRKPTRKMVQEDFWEFPGYNCRA
jgi:hypothetical protein